MFGENTESCSFLPSHCKDIDCQAQKCGGVNSQHVEPVFIPDPYLPLPISLPKEYCPKNQPIDFVVVFLNELLQVTWGRGNVGGSLKKTVLPPLSSTHSATSGSALQSQDPPSLLQAPPCHGH